MKNKKTKNTDTENGTTEKEKLGLPEFLYRYNFCVLQQALLSWRSNFLKTKI